MFEETEASKFLFALLKEHHKRIKRGCLTRAAKIFNENDIARIIDEYKVRPSLDDCETLKLNGFIKYAVRNGRLTGIYLIQDSKK